MASSEQDSAKLKSWILQFVILAQAAVGTAFGFIVAPALRELFSTWGTAMHEGGIAAAMWLFTGIAASTIIPSCICAALIWWLGQQKKLLKNNP